MRDVLFILPVLLLLSAPATAGSSTRFHLGDQGGVIVPVRLNDGGPFMVLLDTGSTHTAITAAVAAAIDAPAIATANVISPADQSRRTIVAIDRLEIGPSVTDIVLASVVPDRSFDREGKIVGLIGQDVLAGLRFTIDFEERQVHWHAGEAPGHGVPLPLSFESGRFLVDLPQQGEALRLVPDSGAGGLVLFVSEPDGPVWARQTGRTVEVVTAVGRRTAMQVVLPRFQVGRRTLRDIPAVTVERAEFHSGACDGLLPLHLFRRVTFDGPRRLLFLG